MLVDLKDDTILALRSVVVDLFREVDLGYGKLTL